jgi:hypothetical protein
MLRFCRPELVSLEQAARIHALAVRILQAIGMEVRHAGALGALHAAGHRVKEGRVFFEPAVVEEHVAEMRRWIGSQPIPLSAQDDGRLSLSVSSYSLFVHDIASDQVVPYTTDWLIERESTAHRLASLQMSIQTCNQSRSTASRHSTLARGLRQWTRPQPAPCTTSWTWLK